MKVVGVDFGATQMRGAVVDDRGVLTGERAEKSLVGEGREASIAHLVNFIKSFLDDDGGIEAVGLGVPGPIDFEAGVVLNPPNLPGWSSVPLRKLLAQALDLPVFMDRDANAALRGEIWKGELGGVKNAVLITWGTGVGGAVLINGEIDRGQSGLAGEIGHMIIDKNGPECKMGHSGCIESFIGGAAVEEKYRMSLKEITDEARNGKSDAKKIVGEIGESLKNGLKNIITLFDPEVIIIDGSVAQSLDLFLSEVGEMPVRVGGLVTKAGVIGAAKLALDNL